MEYLILYCLMLLDFVAYVSTIWAIYGVLPSISQSYYELPEKWNFLFLVFCWTFALPAMIVGTVLTTTPLMFIAGIGIMFVGAASGFKDWIHTGDVHKMGAYTAVAFSQASILIDFKMWEVNVAFFSIAILLFLLGKKRVPNRIWWIENAAFISMALVLGIALKIFLDL
jgi:hypothetical protein